jgi:hypothetical protein
MALISFPEAQSPLTGLRLCRSCGRLFGSVPRLALYDLAQLGGSAFDDDEITPLCLPVALHDLADRAGAADYGGARRVRHESRHRLQLPAAVRIACKRQDIGLLRFRPALD